MPITHPGYYDRFAQADNYDRHLFLAGSVLQAAELNEVQSASQDRLQRVTDTFFVDGNILSGANIVLLDGVCTCEAGAVYLGGAIRGVTPRTFTIATTGEVAVGIYLTEAVVTYEQDPDLRDPAISPNNYQEPGAARWRVTPTWGWAGEGLPGRFYAVYRIEDGIVLNNATPPQVNATELAISRYDRQSTGGYYVSQGMMVSRLADTLDGEQVYLVTDGAARVNGVEIVRRQARRFQQAVAITTQDIAGESHPGTGGSLGADQVITVFNGPIHTLEQVLVTRQVTQTVTHGADGGIDTLAYSASAIVSVTQGATTYVATTSYLLSAGKISWSPGGPEPGAGTTYTVVYQYVSNFIPATIGDQSFTVTGTLTDGAGRSLQLVANAAKLVTYKWSLPRYDLICLRQDGDFQIIPGVASAIRPVVPPTPSNLLRLAIVEQTWTSAARVINSATRMVAMSALNAINTRIDTLFALMAEERLALNLNQMDSAAKKGVFADPFLDDDLRDAGLTQTAAIFRGELTLGLEETVYSQSLAADGTLDLTPDNPVVSQLLQTAFMLVNPYDSFAAMPGVALLSPAVDLWTDFATNWLSPVTRRFNEDVWSNEADRDFNINRFFPNPASRTGSAWEAFLSSHTLVSDESLYDTEVEKVGTRYVDIQELRQITVDFSLTGFGNGEVITQIIFDGITLFEEVPE